jgi:hypothetical protein
VNLLKISFISLLISSLSFSAYAQTKLKHLDLIIFLKEVETKHDVIFSYADQQLKSVILPYDNEPLNLEGYLQYLEDHTPFKYIVQNDKSILVVPKTDSKTVCLDVYNFITNEAVSNALIKQDKYFYKSNLEGNVYIQMNLSSEIIKIHADDFITREFTIDAQTNDCIKLYISPFYQTLDEVFLTNLITSGIQKVASGGLEINYEEFGLLPGLVEPDVLQSLQALPGIISRRESVSYVNVRGGTHDQNLFLWDGIKMYNTSHFFGMISAFNPYLTQSVKLVKNGTSARYSDGVSSLIDMKTSNAIADSLETSVGINFINADVLVDVPVSENSSIELSSRHSINSLWESPTYNQYFDKVFQNTEVTNFEESTSRQNNKFSFFDATLNYKHELSEKDFLKISLLYAEDDFDLNRFDVEDAPISTRSSKLAKSNLAVGALYERQWSQATKSQFQFYISDYALNGINTNLLSQQSLEQLNEVNEYGIKLNVQTQLSSNLALESGYQFNETGILNSQRINDPDFFSETRNSILTNSLYSQLNYQSDNRKLNLNLGGRLNHYSKFDQFIAEPRFNLSYEFIDDLFLEVLGEQKSQVTSQTIDLQTDFLGVENRRWVLADPEVRPIIESQQISAGLNFIKPNWFINLDVYYKEVDGITTQGQGFQNQFEFVQTHGSYNVRGFDILVNKNFDPFSGWVSYSLSENNYHFNELSPSSFHNNLDIRHVISTGLSYEKNGLKISSGFNWHSGATNTLLSDNQDDLSQQILYGEPNAARLKDYFRLDLSSTYTFQLSRKVKALAGASFLNVFDSRNIYSQFYGLHNEGNIQTFQQNGLRFTPNILFRVTF